MLEAIKAESRYVACNVPTRRSFVSYFLARSPILQDLRKLTVKPPSVGANGIRPRYI
ncbi:MAG: hypothetical protein F6K22_27790 [Okeania sp. SIO2F4]|nr:hypothetical protein [Okeania sp. SIO2F4]